MHFLYIIFSESCNRFYIGETVDISVRLAQHNDGFFKGTFTKRANDWQLKLYLQCKSRKHARAVELFLKRKKSRKFLQYFIDNSNIQNEVLAQFT